MQIQFSCHMICKLELLINESISFHFLFVRWFQSTVTCRWEYFVSLATTQGDWHMTLNTPFTTGNKKMHLSLADSLNSKCIFFDSNAFPHFLAVCGRSPDSATTVAVSGEFQSGAAYRYYCMKQLLCTGNFAQNWNPQCILPILEIHCYYM